MKEIMHINGYDVMPFRAKYTSNNKLAIHLETVLFEPYARLTVNIADSDLLGSDDLAFVDTNNCPWAEDFIKEYELGEPTGSTGKSGFCTYPLYRFNLSKLWD